MDKFKRVYDMNALQKTLIAFTGALLLGAIWRMRGSGGFGSFWGMLAVACVYCFFLYLLFGEAQKITWGLFGVLVLAMAVTVDGWGTIVGQVTGRLHSWGPGDAAAYDVAVNPIMGWVWLIIIGLGWLPLFAFLIAQIFSEKSYSFKEFLVLTAIFYLVLYLGELVFSHLLIPLISPDAYALYANSLVDATPWQDYLLNFKNQSYYETIAGGRNYAAMVSNLSKAIGALAIGLWVALKHKDAKTTKLYFGIIIIFGLSMSASNIFQFLGRGCLYDFAAESGTCTAPEWLRQDHWGLWEYGTGFLAGLGITALLMATPPPEKVQHADTEDEESKNLIPKEHHQIFAVFSLGLLILSIIRPIGSRLENDVFIEATVAPIVYGIGALVGFPLLFWYYKRTKAADFERSNKRLLLKYSAVLLVVCISIFAIVDLFFYHDTEIIFRFTTQWLILLSWLASFLFIPLIFKWKTV